MSQTQSRSVKTIPCNTPVKNGKVTKEEKQLNQIAKMREQMKSKLQEQKEKYSQSLKDLKEKHKGDVQKLKEDSKVGVVTVKEELKTTQGELKTTLSKMTKLEKQVEKLQQQLEKKAEEKKPKKETDEERLLRLSKCESVDFSEEADFGEFTDVIKHIYEMSLKVFQHKRDLGFELMFKETAHQKDLVREFNKKSDSIKYYAETECTGHLTGMDGSISGLAQRSDIDIYDYDPVKQQKASKKQKIIVECKNTGNLVLENYHQCLAYMYEYELEYGILVNFTKDVEAPLQFKILKRPSHWD